MRRLQSPQGRQRRPVPYRTNLLAKIGQERVDALEAWHAPVKSTIEQCQAIEAEFKRKLKAGK
ncbi:recombination protein NinG [Actimicrobium sp. CCC2.4]|uniref:recombination protein NinG n=1 Tax=Actimicrobium sp. CCC2.4 TaxID=3048606 RepID=UPI003A102EC4